MALKFVDLTMKMNDEFLASEKQFFFKLVHLFHTVEPYRSLFDDNVTKNSYHEAQGVLEDVFLRAIRIVKFVYAGVKAKTVLEDEDLTFAFLARYDILDYLRIVLPVEFDMTTFSSGGEDCLECSTYVYEYKTIATPVLIYNPRNDIVVRENDFGYIYQNSNILRTDLEFFAEKKAFTIVKMKRAFIQLKKICSLVLELSDKVVLLGADFQKEIASKLSGGRPYARYDDIIVALLTCVVKKVTYRVDFDVLAVGAELTNQLKKNSIEVIDKFLSKKKKLLL